MSRKEPATTKNGNGRIIAPSHIQPTPPIDEGPYYKAGSPEKTVLFEEGVPGDRLTLTGRVYDVHGKPVAHGWVDFWQANGRGEYDNAGYTLRGHQYTDKNGKYILETVLPGSYPGRTPHIHVKVQAKDKGPVLTTQLFIPGLASNDTDFLYQEVMLIKMQDSSSEGKKATFDFVVSD
jgi:protocatechuate 3,4-dioxygenase beta subunit